MGLSFTNQTQINIFIIQECLKIILRGTFASKRDLVKIKIMSPIPYCILNPKIYLLVILSYVLLFFQLLALGNKTESLHRMTWW